jgi:hypothetical protein
MFQEIIYRRNPNVLKKKRKTKSSKTPVTKPNDGIQLDVTIAKDDEGLTAHKVDEEE